MLEKFKIILRTTTARQSLLTSLSTVINGLLGASFYFLLARFLPPDHYGLFALVVALITLLSDIVDLGSNQALVRFIPKYKTDSVKQNELINLVLVIKFVSGLLLSILLIVFSSHISRELLGRPEITALMPLVGLGVLAQLLFSFSTSISQASERFWAWSSLFIATNFTRIIIMLTFTALNILTGTSSIAIYIIVPLLGFLISLLFIRFKFNPSTFSHIDIPKVFRFNGWVTAFIVVAAIGAKIDTLLTGKLINLSALGVYALANQIVAILPQLTGAIGAVTAPKYSSFDTLAKNTAFTAKAVYLTLGTALTSAVIVILFGSVILRFAGSNYNSAFGPMLVLLLAMCIFLVTSPIRDSILYFFTKPHFFFWLGLLHIIQTVALSYYLIPKYHIMGSALTFLFGQVLIAIVSLGFYYYWTKNHGQT